MAIMRLPAATAIQPPGRLPVGIPIQTEGKAGEVAIRVIPSKKDINHEGHEDREESRDRSVARIGEA